MAETLNEGETAKEETARGMALRCDLILGTVSDWRRMARQGKLVLPDLYGMEFMPVAKQGQSLSNQGDAEVGFVSARYLRGFC